MTLTNRQKFFRKHNIDEKKSLSMREISKLSKVPLSILQQVYNRGIGAWRTNIRSVRVKDSFKKSEDLRKFPRSSRLTKEQWAMARVYSFVMKGTTYKTADADLAKKKVK